MLHVETKLTQTVWTVETVRHALVDAYRVLSVTEGRVGHKRLKAAWPEYKVEYADEVGQQEHKTYRRTMPPKVKPSALRIKRMEIVLLGTNIDGRHMSGWLNGAIRGYPVLRKALLSSSIARAHKYSERQLCEGQGWPLTTHRRNRDKAAQIVADQLNRAGIRPW